MHTGIIPVDVFVIDYYHWSRCGDWRFDEEYFPDAKSMISEHEYPMDKECYNVTDLYMFGSDILVAPVCHEKAIKRQVYLPEGDWYIEAATGQIYIRDFFNK